MEASILDELANCIIEMKNFESIKRLTQEAINVGLAPNDIISKGLAKGLNIVGKKFENGEYFLSDLITSAMLMKEAMMILEPHLKKRSDDRTSGKIIIGTVRGDLHDIGKNIVAAMLESAGFEVIDLGVDVPEERFITAVREHSPNILAMSALLSSTVPTMERVIHALKEEKLRTQVKVIVGGSPLNENIAKKMGADGYAEDAVKAVEMCKILVGNKR
jgi:5-methyltetrahydrofolate--homocysteine methyltransferase